MRRVWFASVVVGASILAACVADEPAVDTSSDDGGGTDGTTGGSDGAVGDDRTPTDGPCDLSKPFGTPTNVPGIGIVNSPVRLSDDELVAYFAQRTAGDAGDFHIFQAIRSDLSSPFQTPTALAELNTASGESVPSVSSDGKKIVYVSGYDDPSAKTHDIFGAMRTSLDASFANPKKIDTGNVDLDNVQDDYPSLEANDTLWFVSTRYDLDASPEAGNHSILFAATAGGLTYSASMLAPNINAKGTDQYYPVLTHDRFRIYYVRGAQLYTATRSNVNDAFSDVRPVSEINDFIGQDNVRPGWVSTDNCRLYFTTGNPSTAWVASKPQ